MAYVYNSQLVRFMQLVDRFHYSADYGFEDAFDLYHKVQEESSANAGAAIGLPALGHALAGSAGTAISKLLLYPLDLAITRLQVQRQLRGPSEAPSAAAEADVEYKSLQDAAEKIYKREGGLKAFYTGCVTDTSKSMLDAFLFFLAYTFLRQSAQRKLGGSSLPIYKELAVGVAAGAFSKLITTPIQQIVTRKQTAAMVAARDPTSSLPPEHSDQLSIKDIALQIRSERGLAGFWAGYSASLILTLNPSLTFFFHNLLKKTLPRSKRDHPGPKLVFLLAALSKVMASVITYPVSLAKTRAQLATTHSSPAVNAPSSEEKKPDFFSNLDNPIYESTKSKDPDPSPPSISTSKTKSNLRKLFRVIFNQRIAHLAVFRSLSHIYRTEGPAALYSGLEAEVLKGFLGHGLTMLLKERIHVLIVSVYFTLLRVTKRWPEDFGTVRAQVGKEMGNVREQVGREIGKVNEAVGHVAQGAGQKAWKVGESVAESAGNVSEGVRGAVLGDGGKKE